MLFLLPSSASSTWRTCCIIRASGRATEIAVRQAIGARRPARRRPRSVAETVVLTVDRADYSGLGRPALAASVLLNAARRRPPAARNVRSRSTDGAALVTLAASIAIGIAIGVADRLVSPSRAHVPALRPPNRAARPPERAVAHACAMDSLDRADGAHPSCCSRAHAAGAEREAT